MTDTPRRIECPECHGEGTSSICWECDNRVAHVMAVTDKRSRQELCVEIINLRQRLAAFTEMNPQGPYHVEYRLPTGEWYDIFGSYGSKEFADGWMQGMLTMYPCPPVRLIDGAHMTVEESKGNPNVPPSGLRSKP